MVRRHLSRRRLTLLGGVAVAAAVLLLPAPAGAANRRVSISDYRWSLPEIEVDLGEHVTWYWVGPDLMHTVTGSSASAAGIDSDPGVSLPRHDLGDSFQLTFDTPGTYAFQCKLHSSVGGIVTVSATPGDPVAEPDPVPESNFDVRRPTLTELRLRSHRIGPRGTGLRFALDERALVDAEYYVLRRGAPRRYVGFDQWRGHIGFNEVRFGARAKHFKARPGRYLTLIRATDPDGNIGAVKHRRFAIAPRP